MKLWFIAYFLIMNLAGLFAMWIDKSRAKRNAWRIRERTLFGIAGLGGSAGALTGMYLFRHKTKHMSFVVGIPLILIAQIILGGLLWKFFG